MKIAIHYKSLHVSKKSMGFKATVTNIVLILSLSICRITWAEFWEDISIAFKRNVIHVAVVLSVQGNEMETPSNWKDFVSSVRSGMSSRLSFFSPQFYN